MNMLFNVLKSVTALLFGLATPALIWVGAGVALYQSRKTIKRSVDELRTMFCSIDNDCPQGYVCMGGRCVPGKTS